MYYKPLKISLLEVAGFIPALQAMRLPKDRSINDSHSFDGKLEIGDGDKKLAKRLVNAGTEHAKFSRGIDIWVDMEFQVGFLVELETYRIGIDTLSTSSTMHNELKGLSGYELAEEKQKGLVDKVYRRISKISYQTLRKIYKERRSHRHPDWQIFCDFIETLPHFKVFINPPRRK